MNHEYFLAMAYGVSALAVLAEIVTRRLQAKRARRQVEEEKDLEAQD